MPFDDLDPIRDRERADDYFGAGEDRWPYVQDPEPVDEPGKLEIIADPAVGSIPYLLTKDQAERIKLDEDTR